MTSLTPALLALRSLRYFARPQLSVGLGIAAATAVIVGALVVGDCVRGSLRQLVLDRLANVQCLMQTPTFFGPELLTAVTQSPVETKPRLEARQTPPGPIIPLIFLPRCTAEHRNAETVQRSSQIQIFGANDEFWHNISPRPETLSSGLKADEIAINQSLAKELSAHVGDELSLRFELASTVPQDSSLGNRDETSTNLPRQRIVAILPDVAVGALNFASTQSVPRNVFCHAETLQDALESGPRFNAALALNTQPVSLDSQQVVDWSSQLNDRLHPTLEDYGLVLERVTQTFSPGNNTSDSQADVVYDYYQLTSRELIIDNTIYRAITTSFADSEIHLLAYLANTIVKVVPAPPAESGAAAQSEEAARQESMNNSRRRRAPSLSGPVKVVSRPVPYSIVVGVEDPWHTLLGPYTTLPDEDLRFPFCWINSWLAEQLQAAPKDWLELEFFDPETIDGREHTRKARLMVAGIVPLTEPTQGYRRDRPPVYTSAPTVFNDPHFTPTVPGLTDKDSIANWDAPFPLDSELIKPVDDEYYERHRLTPKLFLPYQMAAASNMFRSRFGQTTSIRFPVEKFPNEEQLRTRIESALLEIRAVKGFRFEPLRSQLLTSASGTTPFDMLFLSLSFFVIVASLMLVALLFKLGISQRTQQLGLLAAQGFTPARIRGLLFRELTLVALAGAGLGIGLGLVYAWCMVAALRTWWVGAISSPFLTFSFTWASLIFGALAGLLVSLFTLYFVLSKTSRQAPLQALRSSVEEISSRSRVLLQSLLAIAGFVTIAAIGLLAAGIGQSGMARAGSFFGSGMLLLTAGLLAVHAALLSRGRIDSAPPSGGLWPLAWRTIQRNPIRSSLALGLLSVASFLIASMSVFQVSPDPRGYGGFNLIAESSQPIYRNLASGTVRSEQLGADALPLENALILPARMRPGQDASCNNLFQVEQPTILGIPDRLDQFSEFGDSVANFQWASQPAQNWKALDTYGEGTTQSPIPVILDQNTAAWSLKQGASLGAPIVLNFGERTLHFKTVGLLSNSVLQGKLLISEANFTLVFPEMSGYRFFLIRSADDVSEADTVSALEKGWSEAGLDVTSSRETLQRLLGVQNTYISAFQSLGALGLLLGSFGLVAVQLRSVWERRRELSLMQALGFSKSRIAQLLTLETAILLGGGLLLGCLAATVALVPYVLENSTQLSLLGPLGMLAGVLVIGFATSVVAVRAAMHKSVLSGLRSE